MTTEEAEKFAVQRGWTERGDLNDLMRRGLAVYESKLQARLEPQFNNQFILQATASEFRWMQTVEGRATPTPLNGVGFMEDCLLQAEMLTGGEVPLEAL